VFPRAMMIVCQSLCRGGRGIGVELYGVVVLKKERKEEGEALEFILVARDFITSQPVGWHICSVQTPT